MNGMTGPGAINLKPNKPNTGLSIGSALLKGIAFLAPIAGAIIGSVIPGAGTLVGGMYNLEEALAALRGCRGVSPLPVIVSMTFQAGPDGFATLAGNLPVPCLRALREQGAAAVGVNCSLDAAGMLPLVKELRAAVEAPLLIQPNGGQPEIRAGRLIYAETPEHFAEMLVSLAGLGVNHLGGCCGIGPAHIAAACRRLGECGWLGDLKCRLAVKSMLALGHRGD